ncbi:Hsp20/alpha crystallin family protein [Necator americanus]|uniref:Hsp20/alpha crystallin family protein n=1 Tax=Necator americanus TaxID=51031 RepID=W2TPE0_NECAM|nr:Hsp20/alpha crystallin family protein [Necator americanus]ETN83643.1 Hsp20/alpha crystallin family protein [Necator americanus]
MTTYNQTSSYNRTYEKKVIEETPRIRIASIPHSSPFTTAHHIMPTTFPSFQTSFGGNVSSFHSTDDSLNVTMDVSQYKPDDLKLSFEIYQTVSVIGQFIVVEAKHPEKQDEFGFIERHFIRKFNLPRGVQPEGVSSNLTSDGTLTIQALPLKPKDGSPARAIPIKIVGASSGTGTAAAAAAAATGTPTPAQETKVENSK